MLPRRLRRLDVLLPVYIICSHMYIHKHLFSILKGLTPLQPTASPITEEDMYKVKSNISCLYGAHNPIFYSILILENQSTILTFRQAEADFPDELPPKPLTSERIMYFATASEFLVQEGRQIHPIMGDGNCLFRSLSYLLFGNEDNHQQIRQLLAEFVAVNSRVLAKYCFSNNLEEHIARMKYI